jgi:hypothetical protein
MKHLAFSVKHLDMKHVQYFRVTNTFLFYFLILKSENKVYNIENSFTLDETSVDEI